MSNGPFQLSKYVTDSGAVRPIRVQPETVAAWNPAGSGDASGAFVFAKRRNKGYGTFARQVTLSRRVGAGVDSTLKFINIPVLTKAAWDDLTPGDEVSYLELTWNVSSKLPERSR